MHTILTGIADNLCESPAEEAWTRQRDPLSKRVVKCLEGAGPLAPLSSGPAHSMFSHAYTIFPARSFDFYGPFLRPSFVVGNPHRRRQIHGCDNIFQRISHCARLEAIARSEIWLKWICASTGKSLQNLDRWLLNTRNVTVKIMLSSCSTFPLLQLYLCMLILSLIIWKHNLWVKMEEIL